MEFDTDLADLLPDGHPKQMHSIKDRLAMATAAEGEEKARPFQDYVFLIVLVDEEGITQQVRTRSTIELDRLTKKGRLLREGMTAFYALLGLTLVSIQVVVESLNPIDRRGGPPRRELSLVRRALDPDIRLGSTKA